MSGSVPAAVTMRDPILLVDDDRELATVLREFLEGSGYAIRVAETGADAVAVLHDARPSMVLLDLRLPDLDGVDVMRAAQTLTDPPDVVVMTGHATLNSAIAAVEAGAAAYIVKPVDLTRLGTLLARLSRRRALSRENMELQAELAERLREAEALLGISRTLGSTLDLQEALRRVCRDLTRFTGADTVSVYLQARNSDLLSPLAAYRVPKEYLAMLSTTSLPLTQQGFFPTVWQERRPLWSDDVAADPRFTHEIFRRLPHQSGLLLPLVLDGEVAGAFYLVWWTTRRRFDARELEMLAHVSGQVTLLIKNARLYEEARTQRSHLTQILESTSDGIVFVGADGDIESANHRAGELFGVDADTVVGRSLASLVGDDRGPAALRARAGSALHSAQGDLQVPVEARVLHWVAQPTKDASGAAVGMTVTFRDVTEERRISQMKSDFVAFVTHQLRTPLSGIKWMLELASQVAGVPAEVQEHIADAHASADRLAGLVNDLLDISKLESNEIAPIVGATDLAAMTRSVLDDLSSLIRERGHRLSLAPTAGVPPVLVDPRMMRQVVLHLTSNAIKYTQAGGEIGVSIERDGPHVRWAIKDSGIGISKEDQAHLFEKFFRAENGRPLETEGTGLGLYLARLIVERFGGRLWCESEKGRGSTFLFTLAAGEAS